ncbi:MAG: hypothetical protein RMZ41_010945 [Nostoc sp. DedVER02]|uniref:hypothetical protein n=1 Tax=Nostoc sp. DedVER02 TaxID=3075405 RepID=UPI002AD3A065|nr:hypothetical protein [Nostoc sp. DedVER02]MDZ7986248.1 hypothetical protein [Nostoc sp. DedVER02]
MLPKPELTTSRSLNTASFLRSPQSPQSQASSTPRELGGVKGKGEGGKGLNPLPFSLSPALTSAFLGWQTTSAALPLAFPSR